MSESYQVSPGDRVQIDGTSSTGRVEGMIYSGSGVVSAVVCVRGQGGGTLMARCQVSALTVIERAPLTGRQGRREPRYETWQTRP